MRDDEQQPISISGNWHDMWRNFDWAKLIEKIRGKRAMEKTDDR